VPLLLKIRFHAVRAMAIGIAMAWLAVQVPQAISAEIRPCRLEVLEKESGWPVPMVQFRTVHNLLFVSDNAGVIAIDAPELMHRETFFHIRGHGYGVDADGFGIHGVRLTPVPGKVLRVELKRSIIARRLGRLTGAGLFAQSERFGGPEWLESGILGCDSVQTAVHRGRHFWLWGDSSLAHYPLGIFHSSSATTSLQPIASYKPPLRVQYDYFRNQQGRPRGVAKMPGEGPTWLTGYVSLPDSNGRSHLVASYVKINPPLQVYEWGLCVWDDQAERFRQQQVIWTMPKGNGFSSAILFPHSVARRRSKRGRIQTNGKCCSRKNRLFPPPPAHSSSRIVVRSHTTAGATGG